MRGHESVPRPNDVVFTQYLRPHGRPTTVWIERAPDVAAIAKRIIAAGYRFDIEELQDRTVSMTVARTTRGADGEDDQTIAIEHCPNGPAVPAAVDRLIATAASRVLGVTT